MQRSNTLSILLWSKTYKKHVILFFLSHFLFDKVMNEDGHMSSIKDKILSIDVSPGWKEGARIVFSKEGDQVKKPQSYNFKVYFTIVDFKHN